MGLERNIRFPNGLLDGTDTREAHIALDRREPGAQKIVGDDVTRVTLLIG